MADDKAIARAKLRLITGGASIATEPAENPGYLHTVLAQCGMPRRKIEGHTYERTNGNVSLLMTAGKLWNEAASEWQRQSLPYGTKPRLVMIYLSAEAVRTRSRVVDVGHSVREFLMRLGISINGKEHAAFLRQLRALAACDMRLGIGRKTIMDAKPIAVFEMAPDGPDGQRSLWPGTVTLSADFYDSLIVSAVPLDMKAIAHLKRSALALDMYAWLAHRLRRVQAPTGEPISWIALQAQFGEYRNTKDFRREAIEALKAVQEVYPGAHIQSIRGGLRLLPSPPPVPSSRQ